MTYQFGLIGYPIQHSLSPWVHQQFYDRTNINGNYQLIEIDQEENFPEQMVALKNKNLNGFNITVPYKEKIIEFLDEIDESAEQIGAVNTVLQQDGKWIGYNTDGSGYVRALLYKYPHLKTNKDIPILLLGAGGACKGIYHALIKEGFSHITIANRTVEKATSIIGDRHHKAITINEANDLAHKYPLIIQTSSVGMNPHSEQSIIELKEIHENAVVSDIVYQPLKTKLLSDAEKLGASIHFGHTMLLFQAQYAFEIWTGITPHMENLDTLLQNKLEG